MSSACSTPAGLNAGSWSRIAGQTDAAPGEYTAAVRLPIDDCAVLAQRFRSGLDGSPNRVLLVVDVAHGIQVPAPENAERLAQELYRLCPCAAMQVVVEGEPFEKARFSAFWRSVASISGRRLPIRLHATIGDALRREDAVEEIIAGRRP